MIPYGDCMEKRDDDDFWKENKLTKMFIIFEARPLMHVKGWIDRERS